MPEPAHKLFAATSYGVLELIEAADAIVLAADTIRAEAARMHKGNAARSIATMHAAGKVIETKLRQMGVLNATLLQALERDS